MKYIYNVKISFVFRDYLYRETKRLIVTQCRIAIIELGSGSLYRIMLSVYSHRFIMLKIQVSNVFKFIFHQFHGAMIVELIQSVSELSVISSVAPFVYLSLCPLLIKRILISRDTLCRCTDSDETTDAEGEVDRAGSMHPILPRFL